MKLIWLALFAALVAGCGSGGGASAGSAVQTGKVSVELSTQAADPAAVLYGVEFTLHLPAGVTLPADTFTGELPAGVLHPADSVALAGGRYLPASSGTPAQVRVNILDPGGFGTGALATLSCSVLPGATVTWSELSLDGFSARDANGAVIPGIAPHFTVRTP